MSFKALISYCYNRRLEFFLGVGEVLLCFLSQIQYISTFICA